MAYAKINGQRIFFEDSSGNGDPIVMMHGFLMDQSLFDPQVAVLAPKYRCIRFDARAFGKTEWDGKAFDLYDTASDCIGLMNHLGIQKAVIVGMSQGGYSALRMAFTYPDRISALVLMSSSFEVLTDEEKPGYRQMRDTWATQGPIAPVIEGMATALLGPKEHPSMKKYWDAWLPKWKTYSGNAIIHATNALLDRDDISAHMPDINHAALVTHGDADFGVPLVLGERLSKHLRNCKGLVVVPGAAHCPNYTHPEFINPPLLEFLQGHSH